jgi:hypothetical protein
MEIGTIIGDIAYSVQYIADAPKYSDYLPTVQKMRLTEDGIDNK